jgi:hypothetical protein
MDRPCSSPAGEMPVCWRAGPAAAAFAFGHISKLAAPRRAKVRSGSTAAVSRTLA